MKFFDITNLNGNRWDWNSLICILEMSCFLSQSDFWYSRREKCSRSFIFPQSSFLLFMPIFIFIFLCNMSNDLHALWYQSFHEIAFEFSYFCSIIVSCFLVFGHFWQLSYKNTKILRNLCLHFAKQDGQNGRKPEKNHETKVTKIQKTKSRK